MPLESESGRRSMLPRTYDILTENQYKLPNSNDGCMWLRAPTACPEWNEGTDEDEKILQWLSKNAGLTSECITAVIKPFADEHGCRSQHVSNSNSTSVKHLSLLPSPTASSQPTQPHSIHHLSSIICHQWQLPISSLLNHRLDFPNIQ